MGIRKKLKNSAQSDIRATQTERDRAFLRQLEGDMQLSEQHAAARKRRNRRIFSTVGALAAICLITVAVVLPQQLSYLPMMHSGESDNGADAPDALSPSPGADDPGDAPAEDESWQDALGDLVLYLDGWQYTTEEVREGGAVAYYAFSLAQNRERGDVTLQMDIPVGGYDYGGFPLDAPQTVTAGAFTLVYEEHIAQDGADFTAQARGLVQRGGVPRIYVTQFYGVNANFQETLTALLGTRGET